MSAFRIYFAGTAMLLTAGLAFAMTPTHRLADNRTEFDLAAVIPEKFDDWQIDSSASRIAVSADVKAKLDEIYSQVLTRTYRNAKGERIMLSIAYGEDQSDGMRAHHPEVCYGAQGFKVGQIQHTQLKLAEYRIPATRLVATKGNRFEPITYWMTVGERVVRSGWEHKVAQLSYGIQGKIPDGLLFRVSSLTIGGKGLERAYVLQETFAQALLANLSDSERVQLAGTATRP